MAQSPPVPEVVSDLPAVSHLPGIPVLRIQHPQIAPVGVLIGPDLGQQERDAPPVRRKSGVTYILELCKISNFHWLAVHCSVEGALSTFTSLSPVFVCCELRQRVLL